MTSSWLLKLPVAAGLLMAAGPSGTARAPVGGGWLGTATWQTVRASCESSDPFLKLMNQEFVGPPSEQATFAMGCFWRGEGELGSIDGVIATVPGTLGPREVVKVTFNPAVVSYEQLLFRAKTAHVADDIFELPGIDFRADNACSTGTSGLTLKADDGPKFYLQQSPLRAVPMTEAQACRVDGALLHHRSPLVFLSSAQRKLAAVVLATPEEARPNCVGVPIDQAWAADGAAE